jgi:hypothetical protein
LGLCVACGDRRAPFLGTYAGSLAVVLRESGSSTFIPPEPSFEVRIDASPKDERLAIQSPECGQIFATVTGDDTFAIQPPPCGSWSIGGCTLQETLDRGTGRIDPNGRLALQYGGVARASCSDRTWAAAEYASSFNGTRKK